MSTRTLRAAMVATCIASFAVLTYAAPARAQAPAPAVSPSPLGSTTPSADAPATKASEDPAVTVRAKDALRRVQTGTVDRSQLADEYNAALTGDALTRAETQLSALGNPQGFNFEGKAVQGNVTAYVYHVTFSGGADLDEMIAFNDTNKIVRLLFSLRRAQPSPAPEPSSS